MRTIADGIAPHAYGRREIWKVKQGLKTLGPLTVPREFVLMDRAAVGLGSVFLHLKAELNFHRLFEAEGGVQAYIRERRLEAARLALGDPANGEPIYAIAERLGFSDAAHLSRLFRERFGASPSQFRAQGREEKDWAAIEDDAKSVSDAGAFSLVIEAVAEPLARKITGQVAIPTIGIGASPACDGQILVLEDMLGLSPRVPKFVKRYGNLGPGIETAISDYAKEVRSRAFPGPDQVYSMKKKQLP